MASVIVNTAAPQLEVEQDAGGGGMLPVPELIDGLLLMVLPPPQAVISARQAPAANIDRTTDMASLSA